MGPCVYMYMNLLIFIRLGFNSAEWTGRRSAYNLFLSFLFRHVFTDDKMFTRCIHLPMSLIVFRAVLRSMSCSPRSCLTLSIHVSICLSLFFFPSTSTYQYR